LVSRLHRREVEDNYPRLGARFKLLGHATCFCCIRSIPEHILPCGHVLCKPCIQSFGTHVGTGAYEMTYCPFHPNRESWTSRPFRVTFKPKDAGVRVLCLDGYVLSPSCSRAANPTNIDPSGGIRGIIELVLLQSIEMELGGFIPIQNFFDLIVGTRWVPKKNESRPNWRCVFLEMANTEGGAAPAASSRSASASCIGPSLNAWNTSRVYVPRHSPPGP